jgi:UDP-N-acetylmuramate dehydrogenase
MLNTNLVVLSRENMTVLRYGGRRHSHRFSFGARTRSPYLSAIMLIDAYVKKQVSLAPYTTLGIGGKADFFVSVNSEERLVGVCRYAREYGFPILILGGGSNILLPDSGWQGIVVHNAIKGIETHERKGDSVKVCVYAGEVWDEFVLWNVKKGLWGLENLSGIPGTVGGAVAQNVNAYGVTVESFVVEVVAVHLGTGKVRVFSRDECNFEYRNSVFKTRDALVDYCIVRVCFCLSRSGSVSSAYRSSLQSMEDFFVSKGIEKPTSMDVRDAVLSIRRRIGMLAGMYKSAGSFFKNAIVSNEGFEHILDIVEKEYGDKAQTLSPWHWHLADGSEKVSSAFLMECTQFNKTDFAHKDFRGTVGVSPLHTLSLVNLGNAHAQDVRDFVSKIQDTVKEKFGILLEPEVTMMEER